MVSLPIIDLSDIHSTKSQQRLADELVDIYSTLGFAILINHGISQDMIDSIFRSSKAFHQLPLHEKMELHQPHSACGYIPINTYALKKPAPMTLHPPAIKMPHWELALKSTANMTT